MQKKIPNHILPVIVFAQFAGTSLWFAGNAVIDNLILELGLAQTLVGFITMAVQLGFIIGTLCFAILNIADRFSPVKVFLICAITGSLANLATIWSNELVLILFTRFLTGFFLAGIYPVGMKIASDWHKDGLGKALGYLLGALVLGTGFPHLLKYIGSDLPWRSVFIGTSSLASIGGVLLYLTVSDGPHKVSSSGKKFEVKTIFQLFRNRNLRLAAFGYFGHMWELYTFWAFVPVILAFYLSIHPDVSFSISLISFLVIAIGSIGCILGGYSSLTIGSRKVAMIALTGSAIACLLLPFSFTLPTALFLFILFVWGFFVIPDSPQFSALVAQSCDASYVATGLTIVNSLGFALTILSIQCVNWLWDIYQDPMVFLLMLPGPVFGLVSIRKFNSLNLAN